ncbi:MAG: hypothetical protein ACRDQ5_15550 [Sciscionella sp.]
MASLAVSSGVDRRSAGGLNNPGPVVAEADVAELGVVGDALRQCRLNASLPLRVARREGGQLQGAGQSGVP